MGASLKRFDTASHTQAQSGTSTSMKVSWVALLLLKSS